MLSNAKPRIFIAATTIWPISQRQRMASKSCGMGPGCQVANSALAGATIANHAISPAAIKPAPARANRKAGFSFDRR